MITTTPTQALDPDFISSESIKSRQAVQGKESKVLTNIYQEETNIVVWQRELPEALQNFIMDFVAANPTFQTQMSVTPQNAFSSISKLLGISSQSELSENIAELVDMFCCLFELKHAGLRLTTLDRTMCPRFHVDKVPCRLVTTYQGVATEWLPHQHVDRTKLGVGHLKYTDKQNALFQNESDIQQLSSGDVALLKGKLWRENENAGLVHRSPTPLDGEYRLLLTLDFINYP